MSKVLVVNECHLERTPDNQYWSNGVVDYSFFKRYLSEFDEAYVAIRVSEVEDKHIDYVNICSGNGIRFLHIPEFRGVWGYVKNIFTIRSQIRKFCDLADCAIVRTPSAISFQFLHVIRKKMPYALEVSSDPWEAFVPGAIKSKMRPVIRNLWTLWLKRYCLSANGVSYVTRDTLQKKYPCTAIISGESEKHFTTYYSTVRIDSNISYPPKKYKITDQYKLIHVANAMTAYSKGHLEAIEIVKRLNESGLNVSIKFIGDGPLMDTFKQYAVDLGIGNKVSFIGRLPNKADVLMALRDSDLFLFPTYSEGLPRVVIESMCVGTPCVATNVGGIPELLDEEYMAEAGDVEGLYNITKKLLRNPSKMSELSAEGIEKSKEYFEDALQERRRKFLKKLEVLSR